MRKCIPFVDANTYSCTFLFLYIYLLRMRMEEGFSQVLSKLFASLDMGMSLNVILMKIMHEYDIS